MGLRFRKSKKIAPGVRLNIGKKSASVSFGTRGARYTINSKGRRTASVGIPGTGVSYTSSSGGSKKRVSNSGSGKNNGGCLTTLICGMLLLCLLCCIIGFVAFIFALAWIPAIIALVIIPFLKIERQKKIRLSIIVLFAGILSFILMLNIDTSNNTSKLEQPIVETELQTELLTESNTEIQTESETQTETEMQTEIETQVETEVQIQTESETFAEVETELPQSKFYYSTDVVNVRTAPSTDSEVIGALNKTDKIEVTSIDGEWANVIYNGTAAYVAAQFLSETAPQTEVSERLVWIPQNGSKFHCDNTCSNMIPVSQVTVSEAKAMGYGACQKCAKSIR